MQLLSFVSPAQVIVMSATMDVDLFSEYFNKSPVLYLEGRQHPIQVYYTKQPQSDYLQAALVSVFQIHQVVFSNYSKWREFLCIRCCTESRGLIESKSRPFHWTPSDLSTEKI